MHIITIYSGRTVCIWYFQPCFVKENRLMPRYPFQKFCSYWHFKASILPMLSFDRTGVIEDKPKLVHVLAFEQTIQHYLNLWWPSTRGYWDFVNHIRRWTGYHWLILWPVICFVPSQMISTQNRKKRPSFILSIEGHPIDEVGSKKILAFT